MKYEYMELEGDEGWYNDEYYEGRSEVTLDDLNRYGAEGWKVIHVSQWRVLLMREIGEYSGLVERVLHTLSTEETVADFD